MDRTFNNTEVKERKELSFLQVAKETVKSGIWGFSLFFTVLIFTKYLAAVLGTQDHFSVEFEDVILASIGFFLMGLIKLLEEIKDKIPS